MIEGLEKSEREGMEGEPYLVTVLARANPSAITYTWTRDGLPLSSGVNSRVVARGPTLNITRLERNDAGTYNCETINDEGTTFYQLNLTVQCKPSSRVSCSVSHFISDPVIIGIHKYIILYE